MAVSGERELLYAVADLVPIGARATRRPSSAGKVAALTSAFQDQRPIMAPLVGCAFGDWRRLCESCS